MSKVQKQGKDDKIIFSANIITITLKQYVYIMIHNRVELISSVFVTYVLGFTKYMPPSLPSIVISNQFDIFKS